MSESDYSIIFKYVQSESDGFQINPDSIRKTEQACTSHSRDRMIDPLNPMNTWMTPGLPKVKPATACWLLHEMLWGSWKPRLMPSFAPGCCKLGATVPTVSEAAAVAWPSQAFRPTISVPVEIHLRWPLAQVFLYGSKDRTFMTPENAHARIPYDTWFHSCVPSSTLSPKKKLGSPLSRDADDNPW